MRRLTLAAALTLFLIPAAVEAQPRVMFGGGLSNPAGDFSDVADVGYHGRLGLQVGVPMFPVSFRAEGEYHSFGEGGTGEKYKMADGTLSAVMALGGIGISPYFIVGLGRYNVDVDIVSQATDPTWYNGYHGGFGVSLGALGFGGYAEIRYVLVSRDDAAGGNINYIPFTLGIRF